ncbi:hypothetical protein FB451DRAFT_992578, partial [Mycena latifolia]
MIGGSVKDKEQARHMLRKMVNSMSAKMEIGSPMASMHLLDNPDHYASHKYVTFAWRPYVQFIRTFWVSDVIGDGSDEQQDDEERVSIGRQDGKYIPASGVDNYRYRPVVYNNVTLYEWIQCSEKKKRTERERAEFERELRWAKYLNTDYHRAAMKRLNEEEGSAEDEDNLEDERDDDFEDDHEVPEPSDTRHAFTPDHDLFLSHSVICRFEKLTSVIPNFIGGALPRSDKGDRAAYCMTMLTLFKPWRSPADLKDSISTWDQAFKEHDFTPRQNQLMRNFNVRYECNDARDDHFAQMKKKMAEAKAAGTSLFPPNFMSYKDKFADDLNDFDYGSDDDEMVDADDDTEKGPKTLKLLAEAKSIRNIMQTNGWLDACKDGLPRARLDRLMPPFKPRAEWASIVKHQRMALTANKLSNLPPVSAQDTKEKTMREGISILPHCYFNHKSNIDAQTNSDIMSSIVMSYKLNTEQSRAFKIVADHASGAPVMPLRMYMGGMGGTGKTQVLHAIIDFFTRRKEEHRFIVLGPTGSTAALLNGST